MIYEGWAAFGDTEVWNNARTYAYAMGAAKLRPGRLNMRCPSNLLPAALGDLPYTTPLADGAPWLDAAYPESESFAGLYVTSVVGFDGSNVTREVVSAIGDGGTLGRLRRGPREVLVTGWLFGKTCCSVSYGLRWLASLLADPTACSSGCSGCDGDTLCMLRCLPRPEELELPDCDLGPITDPEEIAVVEAAADRFVRNVHQVGLVSGPTVIEQRGMGCGCCGCAGAVKVEFNLVAANPWLWLPPEECLAPTPFDLEFGPECAVNWVEHTGDGTCDNCPTQTPCTDDPTCPAPPAPPTPPIVATDCACIPLVSVRQCCTAEAGEWFDATAVIDVYGGTDGLHNLVIRGFQNPVGFPSEYFRECDACLAIAISFVPPFSTLHIDGVNRRITLDCPTSGCEPGEHLVFDIEGTPFSWIEFSCQPLLICADADAFRTSADATVGIEVVGREPV